MKLLNSALHAIALVSCAILLWSCLSLQSQLDSLRQKADKSVLFLAQEELSRHGLSLVVVDSTGRASRLMLRGEH